MMEIATRIAAAWLGIHFIVVGISVALRLPGNPSVETVVIICACYFATVWMAERALGKEEG